MPKLDYPRQGEPITHEWGCALVDAINELLRGPEVCSPLTKHDATIFLAQDFQVWWAKTTGTIGARVGTTWGTGDASFLTLDAPGVESTMPGYAGFTAWNPFGAPISSGIRVAVSWTYDRWVILGGDCSGVA